MARYIDADKLKYHYSWWNNENKELFDAIVDAQPTAFDLYKVVQELDDRSTLSRPVGWSKAYEIITLDDAIEIVRNGGKE